jgi:hypothetical protein
VDALGSALDNEVTRKLTTNVEILVMAPSLKRKIARTTPFFKVLAIRKISIATCQNGKSGLLAVQKKTKLIGSVLFWFMPNSKGRHVDLMGVHRSKKRKLAILLICPTSAIANFPIGQSGLLALLLAMAGIKVDLVE